MTDKNKRPAPEHREPRSDRSKIEKRPRLTFNDRVHRGKLHVSIPEHERGKFHYYWAVDNGSRIAELEQQWYERVDLIDGGGAIRHSGRTETGTSQKTVLMRLPIKYYEEDRKMAREHGEKQLSQIQKNPMDQKAAQDEGLAKISEQHGYLEADTANFDRS